MDLDSPLRLKWDIRLENFAATSLTIRLWEMPDVQQKIQNHFTENYNWSEDNLSEWKKIRNFVRDHITSLTSYLPEKVLDELYLLESVIQEKVYSWYQHVMEELKLPPKFAWKIYWDSQGRIDQRKIFWLVWRKERDFYTITRAKTQAKSKAKIIYFIECFAKRNSGKTVNNLSEAFELMTEIIHPNGSKPGSFSKEALKKSFMVKYLTAGLKAIISLGISSALKIFLSKFVKYGKYGMLSYFAVISLKIICDTRQNRCMKDKQMDIFLTFFNALSAEDKIKFFFEYSKLLVSAFLQVWPYQTFFLQIFSFVAKVDFDRLEKVYLELLQEITEITTKTHLPELYKKVNDCVFIKVLQIMGKDLKMKALRNNNYSLCVNLYKSGNRRLFYILITDPDIGRYERDTIIYLL